MPLSHPSWTFSCTMLQQTNSIVKDPTHPSHSLFQLLPSGRRYRSIRARSTRLLNSVFPRLWEAWTQITPPPSEPHANPYLLMNLDHLTHPPLQTPPQPCHTKEKTVWNFFVQFKVCYTQVSGPVQTTCNNTLSLCTRLFTHCCVYTIPQKTPQYMYVYMLMHYKSSCTVPQPAAWLTMFLSAHVQYLCEAFL